MPSILADVFCVLGKPGYHSSFYLFIVKQYVHLIFHY